MLNDEISNQTNHLRQVRSASARGAVTLESAPPDDLVRGIAAHRYLNRTTLFAHLPREDWPKLERLPPPSRRRYFKSPSGQRLRINPFQPDEPKASLKPRASALRSEVSCLYSALAFTMWQYGRVMNAHVTICWKLLGVTDHNEAARLLSLYNHEAAKWLKVGDGDGVVRSRRSRRASGTSVHHVFVYVHEHAVEKGFHSHQLMCLPVSRAQAFAKWSKQCLARVARCANPDEAAVFFSPASPKLKIFKPYEGAREEFAVDRQWRWFRYLTKSLDPEHREGSPIDGAWHAARDVFQIMKPFMATGPVTCRKLAGCSENIGSGARRREGFVSKFERGQWANLYDGSELDEYRAYMSALAEAQRSSAEEAAVRAMLEDVVI